MVLYFYKLLFELFLFSNIDISVFIQNIFVVLFLPS